MNLFKISKTKKIAASGAFDMKVIVCNIEKIVQYAVLGGYEEFILRFRLLMMIISLNLQVLVME